METAEILSLVSLISYIAAGICLALALFFWFFFKIPSVIGDLSGRTAKKSIAKMRQANAKSGSKSYRSSATNVARGKLTDTMPQTAKPKQNPAPAVAPPAPKPAPDPAGMPETGILAENKEQAYVSAGTEMLDAGEETSLLADDQATTVLEENVKRTGGKKLTMINEVMLIHTNEVI